MNPVNARRGRRGYGFALPRLEALEDRSLPAIRVTASLVSGVLRVEGTPGNDTILLRENPTTHAVTVSLGKGTALPIQTPTGNLANVPSNALQRVEVNSLDGADLVFADVRSAPGGVVHGAGGNDLLMTTSSRLSLIGGAGTNEIVSPINSRGVFAVANAAGQFYFFKWQGDRLYRRSDAGWMNLGAASLRSVADALRAVTPDFRRIAVALSNGAGFGVAEIGAELRRRTADLDLIAGALRAVTAEVKPIADELRAVTADFGAIAVALHRDAGFSLREIAAELRARTADITVITNALRAVTADFGQIGGALHHGANFDIPSIAAEVRSRTTDLAVFATALRGCTAEVKPIADELRAITADFDRIALALYGRGGLNSGAGFSLSEIAAELRARTADITVITNALRAVTADFGQIGGALHHGANFDIPSIAAEVRSRTTDLAVFATALRGCTAEVKPIADELRAITADFDQIALALYGRGGLNSGAGFGLSEIAADFRSRTSHPDQIARALAQCVGGPVRVAVNGPGDSAYVLQGNTLSRLVGTTFSLVSRNALALVQVTGANGKPMARALFLDGREVNYGEAGEALMDRDVVALVQGRNTLGEAVAYGLFRDGRFWVKDWRQRNDLAGGTKSLVEVTSATGEAQARILGLDGIEWNYGSQGAEAVAGFVRRSFQDRDVVALVQGRNTLGEAVAYGLFRDGRFWVKDWRQRHDLDSGMKTLVEVTSEEGDGQARILGRDGVEWHYGVRGSDPVAGFVRRSFQNQGIAAIAQGRNSLGEAVAYGLTRNGDLWVKDWRRPYGLLNNVKSLVEVTAQNGEGQARALRADGVEWNFGSQGAVAVEGFVRRTFQDRNVAALLQGRNTLGEAVAYGLTRSGDLWVKDWRRPYDLMKNVKSLVEVTARNGDGQARALVRDGVEWNFGNQGAVAAPGFVRRTFQENAVVTLLQGHDQLGDAVAYGMSQSGAVWVKNWERRHNLADDEMARLAGGPMSAAIFRKWLLFGGQGGSFGPALGAEESIPSGGRVVRFRGGAIYWSAVTGAREVHGAILTRYNQLGGAAALGLPMTDELNARDTNAAIVGRVSYFQNGAIFWSNRTGLVTDVSRQLADVYRAYSSRGRAFGVPGRKLVSADGTVETVSFPRGIIYWSPVDGGRVLADSETIRSLGQTPDTDPSFSLVNPLQEVGQVYSKVANKKLGVEASAEGFFSLNLSRGTAYADLDFQGLFRFDTGTLGALVNGNLSLPKINVVRMLGSFLHQGVRSRYDELQNAAYDAAPGRADAVYFSSFRFVDWASPGTVAKLAGQTALGAGGTALNELKRELAAEVQAIVTWAARRWSNLSVSDAVRALASGLKVGSVRFEAVQVPYIHSTRLGPLTETHLGFKLVAEGPPAGPLAPQARLLGTAEAAAQELEAAAADLLDTLLGPIARDVVTRALGVDSGLVPGDIRRSIAEALVEQPLYQWLYRTMGLSHTLLAEAYRGDALIDLKELCGRRLENAFNSELNKVVAKLVGQIKDAFPAFKIEMGLVVETLRFNTSTYELSCKLKLNFKVELGSPKDMMDALGKTLRGWRASAASWADQALGKAATWFEHESGLLAKSYIAVFNPGDQQLPQWARDGHDNLIATASRLGNEERRNLSNAISSLGPRLEQAKVFTEAARAIGFGLTDDDDFISLA